MVDVEQARVCAFEQDGASCSSHVVQRVDGVDDVRLQPLAECCVFLAQCLGIEWRCVHTKGSQFA